MQFIVESTYIVAPWPDTILSAFLNKYLFSNVEYLLFDAFRDFHAINSNFSPELLQIFSYPLVIVLFCLKHNVLLSWPELTDNKAIFDKYAGHSEKVSCGKYFSCGCKCKQTQYCIPEVIATLVTIVVECIYQWAVLYYMITVKCI